MKQIKKALMALVMVHQMDKSFDFIRDEYNRWRTILELPYREVNSIK